jgi:enhancing lycopene biosynthesis protein 2
MRIGILLGGCGHYDGTDASEAVLALLALEEAGERPLLLAPDIPQVRSVDHLSGDEMVGERRGVLRESARLSRGVARALSDCRPDELEAIIIPGGYGPVVNFSVGFAELGKKRRIVPEIVDFLNHFLEARKPVGLISLGEVPVRTLLGQEMDAPPSGGDPRQVRIDRQRRIIHTPGFTTFSRLKDVRQGIEVMVAELLGMMKERARELSASGEREVRR